MHLIVDNGPDPIETAWEHFDGLAIDMAAMWSDPSTCSTQARMEHAKHLLQAEARFRELFLAQTQGARK
jgi:hypothetical protein